MLKSAFRVNDFLSVNGSSMRNGEGSGVIIEVTDTTVTTRAQFTNVETTMEFARMTADRASFTNSDFTRFIMVSYYFY
jgi:hypothetical protein